MHFRSQAPIFFILALFCACGPTRVDSKRLQALVPLTQKQVDSIQGFFESECTRNGTGKKVVYLQSRIEISKTPFANRWTEETKTFLDSNCLHSSQETQVNANFGFAKDRNSIELTYTRFQMKPASEQIAVIFKSESRCNEEAWQASDWTTLALDNPCFKKVEIKWLSFDPKDGATLYIDTCVGSQRIENECYSMRLVRIQ